MKKPWLLQRCKAQVFNSKSLTGEYLKLDYMGSSEFEWGAVPKFQREIAAKFSKMAEYTHVYKDLRFHFLIENAKDVDQYRKYIEEIIDRKNMLKEAARFENTEYDVWLDLTNNTIIARKSEILNNLKTTIPNSVQYMDQQKG